MNLLADEGVDKQIVVRLREEGYSVSYVDPRKILDPQRLMPKKYYKIELGNNAEIHVYFETLNGLIINFVVKLVLMQHGGYTEIIRFDSAHGCPHKDIIDDSTVIRKVWFEFIDNNDGLNLAVKDLKDNFEMYIERYLKWQKK